MTLRRTTSLAATTLLLICVLALMFGTQSLMKTTRASSSTLLKINPSYASIGEENQVIPTTQPITLSIEVENVVDLFSWQVVLHYNQSILNTREDWVWLPSEHVFNGKEILEAPAVLSTDANGAYIMKTVSLTGNEQTFNGSGVLCGINFTAVGEPGVSHLNFTKPIGNMDCTFETYLLDSNLDEISASAVEGSIEVKGISSVKESSIITISIDKSTIYLGNNVTISGNVTLQNSTPKGNVDVTVYNRLYVPPPLEKPFTILETVKTDDEGHYIYIWTPTEEDLYGQESVVYEFKASWIGDETTYGNQSEVERLTLIIPEFPSITAVLLVLTFITSIVILTRKRISRTPH